MDNIQDAFFCINIREFFHPEETYGIGENDLQKILSDFFSPKNRDVERFLKKNAIEFTKKHQSVTYLVISKDEMSLVGYFSLAVKSIKISAKDISNRAKKKLERIGRLDKKENCYTIAAYLIAQLGKNYNENLRKRITGTELLDIAICTLQEIRYALGGMMVYLECEENEFLLNFYEKKNGFYSFSERYVDDDDEMEPHKLIRLMQFL